MSPGAGAGVAARGGRGLFMEQETLILTEENVVAVLAEVTGTFVSYDAGAQAVIVILSYMIRATTAVTRLQYHNSRRNAGVRTAVVRGELRRAGQLCSSTHVSYRVWYHLIVLLFLHVLVCDLFDVESYLYGMGGISTAILSYRNIVILLQKSPAVARREAAAYFSCRRKV